MKEAVLQQKCPFSRLFSKSKTKTKQILKNFMAICSKKIKSREETYGQFRDP
jgi:hypothetical protein